MSRRSVAAAESRSRKTAGEDGAPYDWAAIANDPAFAALKAAKLRFITRGQFSSSLFMTLPVLSDFFRR